MTKEEELFRAISSSKNELMRWDMRILLVGINFYPDLTGVGKYSADMAAYLSGEGHRVHMVTAPPYYPYWQVQPGYKGWQYKLEAWKGIRIFRTPVWVPKKPTGIKRLIHLISFAISSIPLLLGHVVWHPDIVICVAPAFFSAPFAWLTARLSGARSWLHIQDFELDAATSLGMLPAENFLTKWAPRGESWLLARFDRVSTISKCMMNHLVQKGVSPDHILYFPNWVDTNLIFPLLEPHPSLRKTLGIPDDKIVVLYSGNMGYKQGLDGVMAAAKELLQVPDILFVMCGEGAVRANLEIGAVDLPNVRFLYLQPLEKLNQLLNMADIHILPQRADAEDLVMPSKLLGMLASGKPVIAMANPGTEIGDVISCVGVRVPPGDTGAFCEALLGLAYSTMERRRLGEKGRAYVCDNWSGDIVLTHFCRYLHGLLTEAVLKSKMGWITHNGV